MSLPEMAEIRDAIKNGGRSLSPRLLMKLQKLMTPFHEAEPYDGVDVSRDERYGVDVRNRLDLFASSRTVERKRPVLLFLHGGGFVRGDKKLAATPYHDNVAVWAARNGLVGINMTYRLAPQAQWPSGIEDVAAAIGWIMKHAKDFGGDAGRVILMGTSAGATHVAGYLAHPRISENRSAVAGAIMISGHYALEQLPGNHRLAAYFGSDETQRAEQSPLPGLIDTPIPTLYAVAEFDPPEHEENSLKLMRSHYRRHGRLPQLVRLMGHNHFTGSMSINTSERQLSNIIRYFLSDLL